MESFFRYISYVDYFESGLRLRNAGFLRWKMQQDRHKIEIQIKDILGVKGNYPIIEEQSRNRIAYISLDKEGGNFARTCTGCMRNGEIFMMIDNQEINLHTVQAFRIELGKDRILRIPLELPIGGEEENPYIELETADTETGLTDGIEREYKPTMVLPKQEKEYKSISPTGSTTIFLQQKGEDSSEKKETADRKYEEEVVIDYVERRQRQAGQLQRTDRKEQQGYTRKAGESLKPAVPLLENKWKQLCNQYPIVHPFDNEKTFLSIKPADFIILRQSYQKLVHNSFLLHGYYNYQHMILGKLFEGEEAPYYIGVPGVYYERERQAAQIFGFVGFEGTETPVQNGSYGYYMIEVEI